MLALEAHDARERAAFLRVGIISSAIIRAHGGKAKAEDFVPKKRQSAQSATQMANALKTLTLALGGSVRGS